MIDFTVQNEGTIFLLRAHTAAARNWVDAYLPEDTQMFGDAVVVGHGYIADIVRGIQSAGLEVR